WLERLTEIELAVANQEPYKDIAFLQHLTFRKP
ncbi:MAG: class I SAM-dependent methyltransferase, partial [Streptococcus gallolyticus]|nr:class I SAM-dependent methyltransferase [Streptococcus gallolyticus]